jgi:hypothetical protein
MLPCRRQSAPSLLPLPARARVRERPKVSLQGLELFVAVLLARNRQPPPTVAAGAPHAELAAELLTLPSGLLAMVCEAIGKLKMRLGAASACVRAIVNEFVRASCVDHQGGPMRTSTRAQCMPE